MIFLIKLILGLSLFLFSSSLSHAEDVTLTVGSGSGYVGSHCCNPNNPGNNKVDLSLDNQSAITRLDVHIDEENSTDYLQVPEEVSLRCETTTRTEGLNCTVSEQANGKTRLVLDGGTIQTGSGTICTMSYDVEGSAPGGGACRDLNPNIAYILPLGLTKAVVPGEFCFNDCTSDENCDDDNDEVCGTDDVCDDGVCTYPDRLLCDDGLFCNGVNFCLIDECIAPGNPCNPLLCNEGTNSCYCNADSQCSDNLWCNGIETCSVGTGKCQSGTAPCIGYDVCDEGNDVCYDYDNVTVDIGDGNGVMGSTGNEVAIYLENPDDNIKALQIDIYDEDDFLQINGCDVNTARVSGEFTCSYAAFPEGYDRIALFDETELNEPIYYIEKGAKEWIAKIYYDVLDAPEGASTGNKALSSEDISAKGVYDLYGNQFTHYSGNVYSKTGVTKEPISCMEYDDDVSGDNLKAMSKEDSISEVNSTDGSYYWQAGTLYINPFGSGLPQENYYVEYQIYLILIEGEFSVLCDSNEQCNDDLYCSGEEACVDQACQTNPPPCPYLCCDEVSNDCTEMTSDNDCDGILDGSDNCDVTANGPSGGTCSCGNEGRPCMRDDDCGDCGFCSMNQEDTDGDGVGDVCDSSPYADLCQSYCNRCKCCFEERSAGRKTDYDVCKQLSNHGKSLCEAAGCTWYQNSPTQAYPCMLDICLSESTGDNNIGSLDFGIFKREQGRNDCLDIQTDDLCQIFYERHLICLDKQSAGREVDYNVCKGKTTQGDCIAANCTWYKNSSTQAYPCMLDICLSESTGDDNIGSLDFGIFKREQGRDDCPVFPLE